jgi:hypothetical protein
LTVLKATKNEASTTSSSSTVVVLVLVRGSKRNLRVPQPEAAPPIACQMLDIATGKAELEAACFHSHIGDHSLLLAPWPFITERIAHEATAQCADQGWASPVKRYEAPPMPPLLAAPASGSVGLTGR